MQFIHKHTLLALASLILAAAATTGCAEDNDNTPQQNNQTTCTIDPNASCPAGTQKKSFSDSVTYGLCDQGSDFRYLRDLAQTNIGYCNGSSESCGYICITDTTQVVCEGKGSCSPGFHLVAPANLSAELVRITEGKTPVSDTTCKDGKILDDANTPIASCETEGTCEYFCVREFSFECQCAADEFGNCLPCDGCAYETDLICSDGSCISATEVATGLCNEPGGPPCGPELEETLKCIWYSSAPPPTCTTEALSNYQPPEAALEGCVPQENLFTCTDGAVIPDILVCNATPDCADSSDEADTLCNPTPTNCTNGSISCPKDAQSICIAPHQVCDGINDCDSNADETFCDGVCTSGQIYCDDGSCIDVQNACNSVNDCANGRDESSTVCQFFQATPAP